MENGADIGRLNQEYGIGMRFADTRIETYHLCWYSAWLAIFRKILIDKIVVDIVLIAINNFQQKINVFINLFYLFKELCVASVLTSKFLCCMFRLFSFQSTFKHGSPSALLYFFLLKSDTIN